MLTEPLIRWRRSTQAGVLIASLLIPGLLRADLRERILDQIGNTTSSIDVLVYTIGSPDIARALAEAARQGVRVRVITDALHSRDTSSLEDDVLEDARIPVKKISWARWDLLHDKFVIFDHHVAITASYNFPARRDPAEDDGPFLHDKPSLDKFQAEFDRIWNAVGHPDDVSGENPGE